MKRRSGYCIIFLICLFYWILDSIWSYLSYELNLKQLIFIEPQSYIDTLFLHVPPYQVVSRIMVIALLVILGIVFIEFLKKRQEQEKKNQKKIHSILDSLPDVILEIDPTMHIKWANKTALQLQPEPIGKKCFTLLFNNTTVCEGCYCQKTFATGKIERGIIQQSTSKPDDEIFWENISVPLEHVDEKVTSVLQVSRNVTERELQKKREMQLQQQLYQAQKMETIGNLAGGVAHEFNNMLSIIIGNNELVMEEVPEGSLARKSTEDIRIAGLRARDVVKQLLAFSRTGEIDSEIIDIGLVVHEAMKLIRSSTPSNVEILHNQPETVDTIQGNATQLNQVLINICNNAIDAMPDVGGVLTVELINANIDKTDVKRYPTLKPGKYVTLVISDNGIGMDQEVLDRIFEPYYTTKEIGKGTGIGLAVVP